MVHGALVSDCRGLDSLVLVRRRSWLDRSCCYLEKSSSAVTAEVWCSCGALPCAVTSHSARVMASVAGTCVMDDLHCDSSPMIAVRRRCHRRRPLSDTKIHFGYRRSSLARRARRIWARHSGRRLPDLRRTLLSCTGGRRIPSRHMHWGKMPCRNLKLTETVNAVVFSLESDDL
jgi:hypothetical protein